MNPRIPLFILLISTSLGCTIGVSQDIRLRGSVNPSQVSLDRKVPISIEASVENIANSTETISVDVVDTEGLSVQKPERTTFTLKPGESRVVIFIGILEDTAVPGKYRIEIAAETEDGEMSNEVVFLRVVAERGLI